METLTKGSVLIVDDEQGIRDLLTTELSLEGYAVSAAADGLTGIDRLDSKPTDIVILDLAMPGIDGVETLSRLMRKHPELQVIIATGYASIDTAVRCMKLGAFDYIRKPFQLDDLFATVARAIESAKLRIENDLFRATQEVINCRDPHQVGVLALDLAIARFRGVAGALTFDPPNSEAEEHVWSGAVREMQEAALAMLRNSVEKHKDLTWVEVDGIGWLITPISRNDGTIGYIVLGRSTSDATLSQTDAEWIGVLTSQAALAFENAHLVQFLEERVRQRTRELEQAKDVAEAANRSKSRFLTTASHELLTPIASILSFAEILLEHADSEDGKTRQEFLGIIKCESERLSRLIAEILDLAKFEAGEIVWRRSEMDLGAVVQKSVEALTGLCHKQALKIVPCLPPDATPFVGDPGRIRGVVSELLINALKFSRDGQEISITLRQIDNSYEIRISDRGCGVPDDEKELVFERFVQGGNILTDKPTGMGLGLSIAREVVRAHDGSVHCEDNPGGGAVFVVRLPVSGTSDRPAIDTQT